MIISNLDPNFRFKHFLSAFRGILPIPQAESDQLTNLLNARFGQATPTQTFLYNSGRNSLSEGLSVLSSFLPPKTEVILSGYTCLVVVNAILKAGLKPVYCDIKAEDLRLDQADLQAKITGKTLAVIVQNTFGIADDVVALKSIADKHNIYLIEDFAQFLGADSIVGSFAVLSFGSNKLLASSSGGALITSDPRIAEQLKANYESLPQLPKTQLYRHLFKIACFYMCYPVYGFGGKYMLAIFAKMGFFPKVITKSEKIGDIASIKTYKLPQPLAKMATISLKDLPKNLAHRQKISALYAKHLKPEYQLSGKNLAPSLFFPILVDNPKKMADKLKALGILVNLEWSFGNIVPNCPFHESLNYQKQSCPVSENIAKQILNLPTHIHITEKKAYKVIQAINSNS